MKEVTLTIEKVSFVGKWVEFWFKEDWPDAVGSFDESAKCYKLWSAVNEHEADFYDHIMSYGFHGKKLTLERDKYNWEIKSIDVASSGDGEHYMIGNEIFNKIAENLPEDYDKMLDKITDKRVLKHVGDLLLNVMLNNNYDFNQTELNYIVAVRKHVTKAYFELDKIKTRGKLTPEQELKYADDHNTR